ncbi:MAG: hypothetical protein AAFQ98_10630 [Bacteroidota bacterium]
MQNLTLFTGCLVILLGASQCTPSDPSIQLTISGPMFTNCDQTTTGEITLQRSNTTADTTVVAYGTGELTVLATAQEPGQGIESMFLEMQEPTEPLLANTTIGDFFRADAELSKESGPGDALSLNGAVMRNPQMHPSTGITIRAVAQTKSGRMLKSSWVSIQEDPEQFLHPGANAADENSEYTERLYLNLVPSTLETGGIEIATGEAKFDNPMAMADLEIVKADGAELASFALDYKKALVVPGDRPEWKPVPSLGPEWSYRMVGEELAQLPTGQLEAALPSIPSAGLGIDTVCVPCYQPNLTRPNCSPAVPTPQAQFAFTTPITLVFRKQLSVGGNCGFIYYPYSFEMDLSLRINCEGREIGRFKVEDFKLRPLLEL